MCGGGPLRNCLWRYIVAVLESRGSGLDGPQSPTGEKRLRQSISRVGGHYLAKRINVFVRWVVIRCCQCQKLATAQRKKVAELRPCVKSTRDKPGPWLFWYGGQKIDLHNSEDTDLRLRLTLSATRLLSTRYYLCHAYSERTRQQIKSTYAGCSIIHTIHISSPPVPSHWVPHREQQLWVDMHVAKHAKHTRVGLHLSSRDRRTVNE